MSTSTTERSSVLDLPDAVLTEREAAAITRLHVRTLQRLAETGVGPRRIRLTEHRIGYWRSDVWNWLQNRTAPAKSAA